MDRSTQSIDGRGSTTRILFTPGGLRAHGGLVPYKAKVPHVMNVVVGPDVLASGTVSRLARSAKPVVMAVNGIAAGGGMSLALAGDLVVAAESAKFTMAYSRIAASPDGSSSYFLPRMIGLRRALELHYTNRILSAREAMDWGLVNRVHPDAEFPGAVAALAKELAQGPTLAFGRAKLLFHQSTQESLETQMELEAQAIAASGHTEDFKNGVAAFAKKQAVVFHGR